VKRNRTAFRAPFTLVLWTSRYLPYAATRRLGTIVPVLLVKLYRHSHIQSLAEQIHHEINGMGLR
jgi:hypothetical protein